jgi:hypothetical protein
MSLSETPPTAGASARSRSGDSEDSGPMPSPSPSRPSKRTSPSPKHKRSKRPRNSIANSELAALQVIADRFVPDDHPSKNTTSCRRVTRSVASKGDREQK